jgi:cysteinyl-tRNA synthetase
MRLRTLLTLAAIALGGCAPASGDETPTTPEGSSAAEPGDAKAAGAAFDGVKSWAYVIQKQTEGDRIERLARSGYDLVVLDDPRSMSDTPTYDAKQDVDRLHATRGAATGRAKIVLAYVDIGEAESYRTYW